MAAHIDGPLYFEKMGHSGPVMAFIHPNPMDQSCWLYQMAHFSTWYRCIAIDLPGYGRSPTAQPGLTMEDLAEGCWEAVDAIDAEGPALFVGCSVGSALIPYLWRQRPGRTSAVVLAGTGYSSDRSPVAVKRIAFFESEGLNYRWRYTFEDFSATFRATPAARYLADLFCERNATGDAASIIHGFEALAASEPLLVGEVRCPMLVVSGTEDASHAKAVELHQRVERAELAAIPGAGHACQLEQPWAFDAAVIGFLARHGLHAGALDQPSRP